MWGILSLEILSQGDYVMGAFVTGDFVMGEFVIGDFVVDSFLILFSSGIQGMTLVGCQKSVITNLSCFRFSLKLRRRPDLLFFILADKHQTFTSLLTRSNLSFLKLFKCQANCV